MGWKSTIDLTRPEALTIVLDKLAHITDEKLADVVEAAYGYNDHPYNYVIVPAHAQKRIRGLDKIAARFQDEG
jgi:hypothetical protein